VLWSAAVLEAFFFFLFVEELLDISHFAKLIKAIITGAVKLMSNPL